MKKYRIAVIALLALFALGAAGFVFSSLLSRFNELARQERQAGQAAFRQQESEFRKLSAEYAEWLALPEALRKFRRERIISLDDFRRFRDSLNACLDDNGFGGANISFQFGARQNRLQRVTINFTLNGGYRELKRFIFDMEKVPKMHFFKQIVFSGGSTAVTAAFTMEAYLGD